MLLHLKPWILCFLNGRDLYMRRLKICSLFVFVAFLIPVQFVAAGGDVIKGGPLAEKDEMKNAAEAPEPFFLRLYCSFQQLFNFFNYFVKMEVFCKKGLIFRSSADLIKNSFNNSVIIFRSENISPSINNVKCL